MVGAAAHSFFIATFSVPLIRLELFFPLPRVNDKFGSARAQPVHRARAGKTRVAPSDEAASERSENVTAHYAIWFRINCCWDTMSLSAVKRSHSAH